MSGNDFIGHQPSDIQWSPDGSVIYFQWEEENSSHSYYYLFDPEKEAYGMMSFSELQEAPVNGFIPLENGQDGGYFKKGTRLYFSSKPGQSLLYENYSNYQIFRAINEHEVILESGQNLFYLKTNPFLFQQITRFSSGKEKSTGAEDSFLEIQQKELFETVRQKEAKDRSVADFRKNAKPKELSPFYLNDQVIGWSDIDMNRQFCLFRADRYPDNPATHIESYLTESGYSRCKSARSKVGKQNPSHEFYLWNLKEDSLLPIDLSKLNGIKKRADFLIEDYAETSSELENPKNVITHGHGFNDANTHFLFEVKSYDNKDRWICTVDIKSGKVVEIDHQHDEAWIGGPGISGWNMVPGNCGWIDSETCYFQSEESGYSHLYSHSFNTGTTTSLTTGKWEVHGAQLSKDKTKFYITANKNHPGNREFYVLELFSKKLIPILTEDGNHQVSISPDETQLAIRYSYKNKPWELYTAPLEENAKMGQITSSQNQKFKSYEWRDVKVTSFKARDGKEVPARLYRPSEKVKNGAAVIFVHGAGYLQNAHNWWSGYYREYMFNNLLCDLGYTVLDIDYRASKGYGRNWRTAIYRHMGGMDLSDQLDGREFLIRKEGIDKNRIGMYGGSYGGFITLMALLTEPGKFKCGAALRSVTDWAHYNHEYTSNILNTPEEDPIAFRRSSPIYFAENLSDELLLLHGIEDDNVQYQDVVRLSQRFIELQKKKWNLVGFPIEPHGFQETTSWIEEYRRILELFETELR